MMLRVLDRKPVRFLGRLPEDELNERTSVKAKRPTTE